MNPATSIRYVPKTKRKTRQCYICNIEGEHKWIDTDINGQVCSDCLGEAVATEKLLQPKKEHAQ